MWLTIWTFHRSQVARGLVRLVMIGDTATDLSTLAAAFPGCCSSGGIPRRLLEYGRSGTRLFQVAESCLVAFLVSHESAALLEVTESFHSVPGVIVRLFVSYLGFCASRMRSRNPERRKIVRYSVFFLNSVL